MDDVSAAKTLIRLLDLTSLSGTEKEEDIISLCKKAHIASPNNPEKM